MEKLLDGMISSFDWLLELEIVPSTSRWEHEPECSSVGHLKLVILCRYVCLYDVEDKILLRRVQISANRSLDGILDQLSSKDMTDAGPAQLLDDAASDEDELLPPTIAGTAISSQCC